MICFPGIRLRPLLAEDESAFSTHLNDPDIQRNTLNIPPVYGSNEFNSWMKIVDKRTKAYGKPINWVIENDDRAIGSIGFDQIGLHRAEIGYWLAKPFWGQGIMTAAIKTILDIGFDNYGLERIEAHVFHFNEASARVLEKTNFKKEGYLKKYFFKDGVVIDGLLFGIVR